VFFYFQLSRQQRRCRVGVVRYERPVRGHTGKAGGNVTDRGGADRRMCSVRADDHICALNAAVGELHDEPLVDGGIDTGDSGAQPHDVRRQRTDQQIDQVRPVEGVIRRSELSLGCGGERLFGQYAAVFPSQQPDGIGTDSRFAQFRTESESFQHSSGIGAELNSGAHLTERVRLLKHLDTESGLREAGRSGQAADPAADDHHIWHGQHLHRKRWKRR
jgi:hypothetical protein